MKNLIFVYIAIMYLLTDDDSSLNYMKNQVEQNSKNNIETILVAEKIPFNLVLKTLKGYGNKQNDGTVIFSGSKLISDKQYTELSKKYSKEGSNQKWELNKLKNFKLKIILQDSISKSQYLGKKKKTYFYYLSNDYFTNDKNYKFYFVSKNSSDDFDSPIFASVFLYKKNNLKWQLVDTINVSELY